MKYTVLSLPTPTMKDLMNNVHTVKTYELGIQLDINENDINTTMVDHKNDAAAQLRQILSLYLRQTVEPSWPQVVNALYAIDECKCAADIEKKFGE